MDILKVGPCGEIVLPEGLLARYGLKPGDSVRIVETAAGVWLVPTQSVPQGHGPGASAPAPDRDVPSREDFLADPLRHLRGGAAEAIPPDWVRDAWGPGDLRDEAIYSLSRSISKVGTLDVSSDWVDLLSRCLSVEQALDLYQELRDGTGRCESEWRGQFEAAFPFATPLLPPIDRRRELTNRTLGLFFAIASSRPDEVRAGIGSLREAEFAPDDARLTTEVLALFFEGEEWLAALGPADPSPDRTDLSALELATLLGAEGIVDQLRRAGATR